VVFLDCYYIALLQYCVAAYLTFNLVFVNLKIMHCKEFTLKIVVKDVKPCRLF